MPRWSDPKLGRLGQVCYLGSSPSMCYMHTQPMFIHLLSSSMVLVKLMLANLVQCFHADSQVVGIGSEEFCIR